MRVLDAIQGHAPRNVSEGYGDVTIKAKANAIAKFPAIDCAELMRDCVSDPSRVLRKTMPFALSITA